VSLTGPRAASEADAGETDAGETDAGEGGPGIALVASFELSAPGSQHEPAVALFIASPPP
jgi:hypothetical protein